MNSLKCCGTVIVLSVLALMTCTVAAASPDASEPVDQDAFEPFKLTAGNLAMQIAPSRAFTIRSIWYRGAHVGLSNGHYGFVYRSKDHHWIGTGHREGGREEVLSVELTVNGEPREMPTDGQDIEVESASIVKSSRLHGLLLTSRTRLYPDRIEQHHDVSFAEKTHIKTAYAFMHAWTPRTKHWLARQTDGQLIEGRFTDEGWQLRGSNVRWTASYEPESETVILTTFPSDLRPGEGIRHAYWDLPRYHKQYYQPFSNQTFQPGDEFQFHMTVRPFHASADAWVDDTLRLAE